MRKVCIVSFAVALLLASGMYNVVHAASRSELQTDTLTQARIESRAGLEQRITQVQLNLDMDQIARRGMVLLSDALKTAPGIKIQDYGSIGGLKTVSIRNFGSAHTGICLDGRIIANSYSGQADISAIDLENIASVRASVAGVSNVFCSARLLASAGTVCLESANPLETGGEEVAAPTFKSQTTLRLGSWNTASLSARETFVSGRKDFCVQLSGAVMTSDGNYPYSYLNGTQTVHAVRENSDMSRSQYSGRVLLQPKSGGKFELGTSGVFSDRGLPGSIVYYRDNPVQRLSENNTELHLGFEKDIHAINAVRPGKLRLTAAGSRDFTHFTSESVAHPEDEEYLQTEQSLGLIYMHHLRGLDLCFAQDLVYNRLEYGVNPQRVSSYTAASAITGVKGWQLRGSVLLSAISESLHYEGEDYLAAIGAAQYKPRLCPELSAGRRWTGGHGELYDFRLAAKESYRLPSFMDLYYNLVGNPQLRPEIARQLSADFHIVLTGEGAQDVSSAAPGALMLGVSVYHNAVKDKIIASPSLFLWTMRNAGRVQMDGVELSAQWNKVLWNLVRLDLSANYAFQYAVDVTDPERANYKDQIAYTPRHSGAGNIALTYKNWSLNYSALAVGKRYSFTQNLPSYLIDPYVEQDLCLNCRWRGMSISAQVLNLGNCNYQIIKWYPMAGRNFRLTMKIDI